jgi:hypothetical protein
MLAFALAAALATATPDGTRLPTGTWCYDLSATKEGKAQVVGHVFQSVERTTHAGKPALKIVVHQRMGGGKFDMRDEFVLDAATLRPFEMANTRFGKPHVRDVYEDGAVDETKWDEAGTPVTTRKPLAQPAWEGNLFGLMFATLPLKVGDEYRVPSYQYDQGEGAFTILVTGERTVDTALGKRKAFVLQAGTSPDKRAEYLIGAEPRIELGYAAGPFSQALSASCAAFDGK